MSPRRPHPAGAARALVGGAAVAATAAIVAVLAGQARVTAGTETLLSGGEVVEIRVPAGSEPSVATEAFSQWRRTGTVDEVPGVHVRVVDQPAHTSSGAS